MNMCTLELMPVMVWPLWSIGEFGELASGVLFRTWMTFHIFGLSEFDIASWRRSLQLSVLVSFIASVASKQASIHSCRFWWIVRRRWFRLWILVRTCGVIQGLHFLIGFVFLLWIVTVEMTVSLKQEIREDKFGSLRRLFIFDLTSL